MPLHAMPKPTLTDDPEDFTFWLVHAAACYANAYLDNFFFCWLMPLRTMQMPFLTDDPEDFYFWLVDAVARHANAYLD
jgi:hypothetical protein